MVQHDIAGSVARPLRFRAIARELDAVAVGIAEVDRLAHAVVGDALKRDAGVEDAADGVCEIAARRIADGEMVKTGVVWRRRGCRAGCARY